MNLRRQLLLVSILTLILPWAGCQFIRETESALREGQQQMLAGTARAIADSLSQFPDEMLAGHGESQLGEDQLYGQPDNHRPTVRWSVADRITDPLLIDSRHGRPASRRETVTTNRQ